VFHRNSLTRELSGLVTFVDLFILSKNLPIIDYGVTFDKQAGLDPDYLIQKCNQFEKMPPPQNLWIAGPGI
jgi:hypothetical protein